MTGSIASQIGRLDCQHLPGFAGQFIFSRAHLRKQGLKSGSTKEPEYHLDAEIGLKGFDPATTEEPREIGGGGVGGI